MKKQLINYETLLKVTKAMSMSTEPEEVVQLTVESIKSSLEIKRISEMQAQTKAYRNLL